MSNVGTHVGPAHAACVRAPEVAPKYHLKPVAIGWPSEALTSGLPDRTCVVWSFAVGIAQFSVKSFEPALPRTLFASNAKVRAFATGLCALKSAVPPANAPFVVTEVQQPAPLLTVTPPT